MARIKNDFFKISGSMGGMTFYQDEKGTVVKQKSEVSEKRIKTHPRSQRTRESNMEMGGASMAAKALRQALNSKKRGFEDQYFSGRLSGQLRRVVGLGEGSPGKRKLDLRKNGSLLEKFEFIRMRPVVYSVGGIKEKPTLNAMRNQVYWTSPILESKKNITKPENATHFKFILGAGTVSNYEYNVDENKYLPLETKFRNLGGFAESEPISLNQKTIARINLHIKLTEETAVPEDVAVLTMVGVSFLRNVNGELLELEDSLAMRVIGVG